jgi:F0F1-type ATP synthase membrane subunit b/b'
MDTDQNTTNNNDSDALEAQLKDLLEKSQKDLEDMDVAYKDLNQAFDEVNGRVDATIANIDQIQSDLDQAEKTAGDELDALILEQAEDLASE